MTASHCIMSKNCHNKSGPSCIIDGNNILYRGIAVLLLPNLQLKDSLAAPLTTRYTSHRL